ncbi:acetyl-CoA C-acetyltransferase [Brevibacillus borstelensis]|uniref:acetyl-CoA C-acetyltransferase n=1 Tax=Brevibacillus borstelensis TaxID=45462 RepID=UPI002E1F047F|nr:acetyl-CoA C-acetyltransferase [Brevibacillus borstelensis]MED1742805.1 acetyl-CoA C-acetyltransferase [Brevibacillus borstelensis]
MKTVIAGGARTPFGKLGGSLKDVSAVDLGAIVIREALQRSGVSAEQVDEVIMGMVVQAGAGQIPSRQAARKAGVPWSVASQTINKVCASGMRAVTMGDQIIRAGDGQIIVSGGMESMSNAPYALAGARYGLRMGDAALQDLMMHDGLTCPFDQVPMAIHGSNVAEEYGITREEQDRWAYRSQQRAVQAMNAGLFDEEIVPVAVPQRRGEPLLVTRDEAPRPDTTLEGLAKLPPVYKKDGTITAGNAPGINDGAAAMVLMSEERAAEAGVKPLATILGHAQVGAEAPYIATTPGLAIQKLLEKTGTRLEEIELFEVNEAFAAVTLTSGKIVGWDEERVNVNGGAIALGHPIGASGARIVLHLAHELKRRGGGLGVAAICSGAAQGDAILIKVE